MINSDSIFKSYTDEATFSKIVDYGCVSEMWAHSVATYPDNVAIVDGREVTFRQLNEEVAALRGVLADKGIKSGDNVGIYCPNSLAFVKAYLAAATLGACAVLMPPHLDMPTVFGCTMKFALNAIVYDESLSGNLTLTKERNPKVALIEASETSETKTEITYPAPTAPCAILFTGGTTGKSKGALLSQQAVMRGVKNGCYGIKNIFEQRYFLVLPLTHVFGFIRNLLSSLYTGSALYICRNTKNMFREIPVFRPTTLVLVPALAEMALNLSKQFGKNMLGADVKTIICGAATVAPYLAKEYDKLGITLRPGYGLTESANLVSGNPDPLKLDSRAVGYIYPDMEYKIVDGELWLKGINMLDCYVGEPEENANAFEDGWFKTGDLVKIENGLLFITGRKKEIIVLSSGENISPAEIENKFYAIDAIQDCLVYDNEDSLVLEVLPRMAVLKALGVENIPEYLTEKIQAVNATLLPFEKINKIIIRDTDFIRSAAMKIVRGQNAKK